MNVTTPSASNNLPSDNVSEIGRIGRIPVRNLWLLMLYASELFRELEHGKYAVEDNPDDIPDLVAKILCSQVEKRIQRNLSYGYLSRNAVLSRVRGRIDHISTERRRLLDRGKVACQFEELTIDTPRNRYVHTALEKLSKLVQCRLLAHQCSLLAGSLRRMGVSGECSDRRDTSISHFGRHDINDQPMVTAAQLAFNLALPNESKGTKYLPSPEREIVWVRKLYEKGVAGFYSVALSPYEWRVDAAKAMGWQIETRTQGIDKVFPSSLRTDVVLDHLPTDRRVIIDTKFNSVVTQGWYREETIRSGYVYQMYAYLRSQEGSGDLRAEKAAGLLLHPSVGNMINEAVVIQGHEIRFATVDLGATASEIRERLLNLLEVHGEG